ncbi:MAG: glycosyltransferase [Sphingomicrobium sp.]
MNAPLRLEDLRTAHPHHHRHFYVSVRIKFLMSLTVALLWTAFSLFVAKSWMRDLARVTDPLFALWTLTFIAFVPGFMNAFLATSLLLDRRPPRRGLAAYPGVTILVAAYNEEAGIRATIESIARLNYCGMIEAIVINDGSRDNTVAMVIEAQAELMLSRNIEIRLLDFDRNRGKAAALNSGLEAAKYGLICTIDGDSRLRADAPSGWASEDHPMQAELTPRPQVARKILSHGTGTRGKAAPEHRPHQPSPPVAIIADQADARGNPPATLTRVLLAYTRWEDIAPGVSNAARPHEPAHHRSTARHAF